MIASGSESTNNPPERDVERHNRTSGTRQNGLLDDADIQKPAALPDQRSEDKGRSDPAHTTEETTAKATADSQQQTSASVAVVDPVSGSDNFLASGGHQAPDYPHDSQQQLWHTAGFTDLKESSGIPGTTLKPNWFACWRDGSKWLLDPNTKRHTCMSDSPFTHWRIDSRGPIDPKTNAVRH